MSKSSSAKRPVNLDLATVQFPITAYASILHRVCAVIIWVGLAFMLYLLWTTQSSPEGYGFVADLMQNNFFVQFITWGFLTALGYYCMGGTKHLIQELGYFEDFEGGTKISWAAIILGVVLSILSGIAVWV